MNRVTRSLLAAAAGLAGLALCACGGGSASAGASAGGGGAGASVSVQATVPTANVTVQTQQPQQPTTENAEWTHAPVYIEFESGGTTITENMRQQIATVVQSARTRTDIVRVRVEGHADGRGNAAANQALSLERANAVAQIMINEGVPREMLETVGYGDTQQMTSESTASDLQRNRRVEFSILVRRDGTAGGY